MNDYILQKQEYVRSETLGLLEFLARIAIDSYQSTGFGNIFVQISNNQYLDLSSFA